MPTIKFTDMTSEQVHDRIMAVLPKAEDKFLRNYQHGVALEIDTNFRLFIRTQPVPHPYNIFALQWQLLQKPYNKIEHKGAEPVSNNDIETAVKNIIRVVENYLSTDGQMRTYASITLKTLTGIGPLTP